MWKLPVSLLLLMSLAACAANTTETAPVRAVSDYCLIAKPITFARKQPSQTESAANSYDTDETATQVEAHDVTFDRLCPAPAAPVVKDS